MNALTLLAIAVAILALGYRYFARFLAAAAPTPRTPRGDPYNTAQRAATEEETGMGAYAALGARASVPLVLAGAGLLSAWGWTPGFLWILTSGALFAGAYAIALVSRDPSHAPVPATIVYVLGLVTNAFSLLLLATLLAALPGAAAAYVLELGLFAAIARWRAGAGRPPAATVGLAMVAVAGACIFGAEYPLTILGHLELDSGAGSFGIGAVTVWAALILIDLRVKATLRQPLLEQAGALQLLAVMALALLAVLLWHPPMAIPAFHRGPQDTHALPGLVLMCTGLPLGAIYFYWASEDAAPRVSRTGSYALSAVLTGMAIVSFLAVATLRPDRFALFLPGLRPTPFLGLRSVIYGLGQWLSVRADPSAFMLTFAGASVAIALRSGLSFGLERQAQAGAALAPESRRFGDYSVLLPLALTALATAAAPREAWELFGAASLLVAGRLLWQADGGHMNPLAWIGVSAIVLADWALVARLVAYWHERRGLGAAIAIAMIVWQTWTWRRKQA
ncbi:MAG: hypothetical protein ACYCP0_08290 [Acidiferrobacteraceae bacterium]